MHKTRLDRRSGHSDDASASANTPQHGVKKKQALFEMSSPYKALGAQTSLKQDITDTEFWASLPLASKLLILLESLESVLWILLFVTTLTQVPSALPFPQLLIGQIDSCSRI